VIVLLRRAGIGGERSRQDRLGESETLVGNALRGARQEIVLATKVRLPMSENFNRSGATRVNIMREVEGSLQRLQTDYIDLYQVHGWDSNTPLGNPLRSIGLSLQRSFGRSGRG
jgi:aryl-alcohol dehydrogenase-like predicted oxidoreductase